MSDQEVTIVDGSCDAQTYALIAATKSTQLAIRPFLIRRPAKNRSGNTTGEDAIAIWCRVHLQNPGVPEEDIGVPSKRTAKGFGLPLDERSRYWRNDVYLQVALCGAADEKYLTKKVKAGLDTLLEALVENISPKHKLCNKEATIDWLASRLANGIHSMSNKEGKAKNKAALLSTPEFGSEGDL